MVRNVQATTTTGLRKNRVTQKTRLHVVRGQLDTDALLLSDDEERHKVLASQGVDAEDANEHHLQAVLNGHRKPASDIPGKQTAAHIPIPDAAGIVEIYESLYPAARYNQPTTHLRFSDALEETIQGGLAGGFAYFLDERDAEWIAKNNQEARGEGTSASASSSTNGALDESPMGSIRGGRRGTRGKGKEPEHVNSQAHARVILDEDEFELVMGLFEKFTEDKFPFIHISLDEFPTFADYEHAFASPLPPATFASYMVPASVPPPERLVLVAQTIYPHWKARKVEREGQRVVPQLDYDDSRESSYICFRRRDVKPIRRTRASSTTYTDKLARLRSELHMSLNLTKMVLEREEVKLEAASAAQEVWRTRCQLVEKWRAGDGKVPGVAIDDSLLFDRERVPKKPKVEGLGRIILGLNRRPMGPSLGTPSTDQHSPLTAHLDLSTINTLSAQGYISIQSSIHDRYSDVQSNVEHEMTSSRARDNGWEDILDLPYQPPAVPASEKLYRSCLSPAPAFNASASAPPGSGIDPTATLLDPSEPRPSTSHSPPHPIAYEAPRPPPLVPSGPNSHPPESAYSHASVSRTPGRSARSLRLRTGRGGRLHLDRRLHASRTSSLLAAERARTTPSRSSCPDGTDLERDEQMRWESREWRPERESLFGVDKVKAKRRKLGEEYWAHESVYVDRNVEPLKRKTPEKEVEMEMETEGVGFEHSGYGLGLVAAAEWEKGPGVESREWKVEPRSCESEHPEPELAEWRSASAGRTADDAEWAWRIDERWRYDTDGAEEEDRYLLDDFQPKFLRTMITLLDSADHDSIKTDTKYLAPPIIPHATPRPSRSSSRLGEQERMRLASLRSQRAPGLQLQPPPMLPTHPSVLQTPPAPTPTPPLPLPQISSGRIDEQIRKMARQTPIVSPTAVATPQTVPQRVALPQMPPATATPSQPNGSPPKPTPFTNGIAGDSGATIRVSSPARLKSHTPSPQQQQQQQASQQGMGVNGFAAHQAPNHLALHPGHAQGLNAQQYVALRNVFGDLVPGTHHHHQQQQQQQQQQQGRPQMQMQMQMPGTNVNLQMGPGNLNLKLPPTRPGQLRMNGVAGAEANLAGQGVPMHANAPHVNATSPIPPHARGPSMNGHLMAPNNGHGRATANTHLLGRASPLAHPTLANSPHHSHLVSLHSSSPQPRPTAPLAHQQVVGGAGQGHGYS